MRKFLTAWLTATLLIGLLVAPVTAKGPKCADFQSTSDDGSVLSGASWDGGTGEVNARFFLGAPACKNITYTLVIVDDDGSSNVIATHTVTGDGSNPLLMQLSGVADPDNDGDVCAYVTSSQKNRQLDRAPADGCVILLSDGTSPAGGKGF